MTTTLAFACDHAAVELKDRLIQDAQSLGYQTLDLGTHGPESVDYPDYANNLAETLKQGKAQLGVLLCGSGIGISIAANRHPHIRAALCHNEETAKLSRQHNDANVLVLGARIIDEATAKACLNAFLSTAFEGGRHQGRVAKLSC